MTSIAPSAMSSMNSANTQEPPRKKRGPKPGTDAARRGGEAVKRLYGVDFYSKIGKKGGEAVKRQQGPAFYRAIGKKGGDTTSKTHGAPHYSRIGRIGGQRSRSGGGKSSDA